MPLLLLLLILWTPAASRAAGDPSAPESLPDVVQRCLDAAKPDDQPDCDQAESVGKRIDTAEALYEAHPELAKDFRALANLNKFVEDLIAPALKAEARLKEDGFQTEAFSKKAKGLHEALLEFLAASLKDGLADVSKELDRLDRADAAAGQAGLSRTDRGGLVQALGSEGDQAFERFQAVSLVVDSMAGLHRQDVSALRAADNALAQRFGRLSDDLIAQETSLGLPSSHRWSLPGALKKVAKAPQTVKRGGVPKTVPLPGIGVFGTSSEAQAAMPGDGGPAAAPHQSPVSTPQVKAPAAAAADAPAQLTGTSANAPASTPDDLRIAGNAAVDLLLKTFSGQENAPVLKSQEALRTELDKLPARDPRRDQLLKQYQQANISDCANGMVLPGTEFKGSDFGGRFGPDQVVVYEIVNGKRGLVLTDPKDPHRQTFESFDGSLILAPRSDGQIDTITTRRDDRGNMVRRIIDPQNRVVEEVWGAEPDGNLKLKSRLLKGGARAYPALLDESGALQGVVLSDYKKPDLGALQRAGFLDLNDDQSRPELLLQLSRIAGKISQPPQLIRMPPAQGREHLPGDLALAYQIGGTRYLDRIPFVGNEVYDEVLDADGSVNKIVACSDENGVCAHKTVYQRIHVSSYDAESKKWTYPARVQIVRSDWNGSPNCYDDKCYIEKERLEPQGDASADVRKKKEAQFLKDHPVVAAIPNAASFIGGLGQDVFFFWDNYCREMETSDSDPSALLKHISHLVTLYQTPLARQTTKSPGAELMRQIDEMILDDPGLRATARGRQAPHADELFRDKLKEAYRRSLRNTADDPQAALALESGQYQPSDAELGEFLISGKAGFGVLGQPVDAAEAALRSRSLLEKVGHDTEGVVASFYIIGSQAAPFMLLGEASELVAGAAGAGDAAAVADGADAAGLAAKPTGFAADLFSAQVTVPLNRIAGVVARPSVAGVADTAFRFNNFVSDTWFKVVAPVDAINGLQAAYQHGDSVEQRQQYYQLGGLAALSAPSLPSLVSRFTAPKVDLMSTGAGTAAVIEPQAAPGASRPEVASLEPDAAVAAAPSKAAESTKKPSIIKTSSGNFMRVSEVARSGQSPQEIFDNVSNQQDVLDILHSKTPADKIISIWGFSGQGYETGQARSDLETRLSRIPGEERPKYVFVTGHGAKGVGVDGFAQLAKDMGFKTAGVARVGAEATPAFDYVFRVRDSSWGGAARPAATRPLSALRPEDLTTVSQVVVGLARSNPNNINLAYGGGKISAQEIAAVTNTGTPVDFVPVEANYDIAKEKAAKKGQPPPTDHRGDLERLIEDDSFKGARDRNLLRIENPISTAHDLPGLENLKPAQAREIRELWPTLSAEERLVLEYETRMGRTDELIVPCK